MKMLMKKLQHLCEQNELKKISHNILCTMASFGVKIVYTLYLIITLWPHVLVNITKSADNMQCFLIINSNHVN